MLHLAPVQALSTMMAAQTTAFAGGLSQLMMMAGAPHAMVRHGRHLPAPSSASPRPEPPEKKEKLPLWERLAAKPATRFWQPVDLNESGFIWQGRLFSERAMGAPAPASIDYITHSKKNPLTTWFVNRVHEQKQPSWTDGEKRVTEVGAGSGVLARLIAEALGVVIEEVDVVPLERPSLHRVVADMRSLPHDDESREVVLSSHALEYGGAEAFREAFRVLQKGGHLYALVHHRGSKIVGTDYGPFFNLRMSAHLLVEGYSVLRKIVPDFLRLGLASVRISYDLMHKAFFDKAELKKLFRDIGFRNVCIEVAMGPSPLHFGKATKLYDVGWFVTATKPGGAKRKTKVRKGPIRTDAPAMQDKSPSPAETKLASLGVAAKSFMAGAGVFVLAFSGFTRFLSPEGIEALQGHELFRLTPALVLGLGARSVVSAWLLNKLRDRLFAEGRSDDENALQRNIKTHARLALASSVVGSALYFLNLISLNGF